MAGQEVTLRTRYKFKPEAGGPYITLYFENGTNDVILDTNIEGVGSDGETKLTDVLVSMVNMIKQRALITLYDTSKSFQRKNQVLAQGQFGIESDTLQMKVGDGIHKWKNLPYLINKNIEPEIKDIIIDNLSQVVGDADGTDVTLSLDSLVSARRPPAGASLYVRIRSIEDDEVEPDIKNIVVNNTSRVAATVDGHNVSINMQNLVASTTAPEGASTYVKLRGMDDESGVDGIVVDESAQLNLSDGSELTMTNLVAASEPPEGASAYIQIIPE